MKHIKTRAMLVFLSVALSLLLPGCGGLPSGSLTMTGEIFTHIELPGQTKPHAIMVDPNGSITIAGGTYIDSTGFVANVSSSGHTNWIYRRPSDDSSQKPWVIKALTNYSDAVALPDGSKMFCGGLGVSPGNPPGLVTVLGPNGGLLNEFRIKPQDQRHSFTFVDKCVAWNKGFILTGSSNLKSASGVGGTIDYWISFFDSNMTPIWETFVTSKQAGLNYLGSYSGTSFKDVTDHLLILLTDNNNSAIFSISRVGQLSSIKLLQGRFTLIADDPSDQGYITLYLLGKSAASRIVKMGETGDIFSSQSIAFLNNFWPDSAFRLSDGSIAMFGTRADGASIAEVVHLDEKRGVLNKLTPEEPLVAQSYRILAVGRVNGKDEFVYGTSRFPRSDRPYVEVPELVGVTLGRISFN